MREAEMEQIAGWIVEVLEHHDDAERAARIAAEVRELCQGFPVPADAVKV
jgi:glycine hydroxymethyltransferase